MLLEPLFDRMTAFEAAVLPVRARSPRGTLASLMEDRGLTQTALSAAVGTHLSKRLVGERDFTADHTRQAWPLTSAAMWRCSSRVHEGPPMEGRARRGA